MLPLILAALLYLSFLCACGYYTADYAGQRGRSKLAWFIWGALFYPLPYIALALMPRLREETRV
ncbi:hypothetical protein LQG66_33600 [Bradyrhizobium ontarionense]|uniref:Cardiolipin synthase N-terminal domain-containing protein n=1 Tax=Bradyrhizobium ontarionense TaxID=2898149 RepID=A0ABY3R9L5_9BRAD|nr:hypothetical protein [Bradyrhizobium sp. A19]UFZ04074.1 hypothetical protein LQG66_33600 [Bradyrhizobium sp. A19]